MKKTSPPPSVLRSQGVDEQLLGRSKRKVSGSMIATGVKEYPNFQVVATTLRKAKTATRNDWGAICYDEGQFLSGATIRENLEIFDRVGGGDSFASGLIYGFLAGPRSAVGSRMRRCARRARHDHAGRHPMATLKEVTQVMKGVGARIAR